MLESALGIRLLLWTGQTVPRPQPALLDPLSEVEVVNDAESGDGFRLTFRVTKDALGLYDVLDAGTLDPMTRVIVGVVLGVVPEVLIDGVVTRHHVIPGGRPGEATFAVDGRDLTPKLDLQERDEAHDNQPDSVIVTKLLMRHPELGLIPQVAATTDVPIEVQRIPRQNGTDLDFIRDAASRNGFEFYLTPVTVGVNRAYWGPTVRAGVPQPALTTGILGFENVTSLTFGNDALAPVGASGSVVEPLTRTTIPIPALPPLRLPPLSAQPATALRSTRLRQVAGAGPLQAALASAAAATRAPEPITGNGQLDTMRYGAVLRARGLVGVRGAGRTYDGTYYVRTVTHHVKKGAYTQSFSLSRDGTGSLLPAVRP
ncbi:MAG: hypothetical protein L0H79_01390 [Intrasporangium sp.]|uniref:hypothetical protein n=1 Tax=Intrasporangium sp. TaxID=1925024 RepID=UPI002648A9C5|nr:hypothetical protein [Intrasporangium sp.]MDN5794389.1 hypothetical protein [Intrasporangium sp.]